MMNLMFADHNSIQYKLLFGWDEWLYSVLFIILIPALPIAIEKLNTNNISPQTATIVSSLVVISMGLHLSLNSCL